MAKSRINAKSKKTNKSNMPKWGLAALIVLVVAVAGYAIVRFSNAGVGTAYKTISNGGMNCTGSTAGGQLVDKRGTVGTACLLKSFGLKTRASWSAGERGSNTRYCATVFFGKGGSAAELRWTDSGGWTDSTTHFGDGVTKDVCTASMSNAQKVHSAGRTVGLDVKNTSGVLVVQKMYVSQ